MNQNIRGQLGPLLSSFFPVTRSHFDIAIMFSIVEKYNNYIFSCKKISPGVGLKVVNFAHCLHVVFVIGKYTTIFQEGGYAYGGFL